MPNQGTFLLRWFFSVIRDWGWVILICIVLAGVAGAIITSQMPPVYSTSAVLYVEPSKESLTNEYNAIIAAERLASTYSEMLKSKAILEGVIEELDLKTSVGSLARKITTQTIAETQLVKVTVENVSPEKAAAIANALARNFVSYIHATQSQVYAPGLSGMQADLQSYEEKIALTQAKIDALYASEIRVSNELEQLETTLAETRTDIRLLQEDKRAIELLTEQVTDFIQVFQPAALPEGKPVLPYQATVLLLVRQELASGYMDYSSILASERLTQTYSQILQSRIVLQKVIERLELTQSVDVIQRMVKVEPIADTQLIQLSVTSSDVDLAILLANTIADEFINEIRGSLVQPYTRRYEKVEKSLIDLQTRLEETQQSIAELSAMRVDAEIEISYLERLQATDRASRLEIEDDYERLEQLSRDSAASVYLT
ncbi:MAG: Wzz/FepE/Etk N-terminal domain-containing protein [Anaerolineaceae bacterium]